MKLWFNQDPPGGGASEGDKPKTDPNQEKLNKVLEELGLDSIEDLTPQKLQEMAFEGIIANIENTDEGKNWLKQTHKKYFPTKEEKPDETKSEPEVEKLTSDIVEDPEKLTQWMIKHDESVVNKALKAIRTEYGQPFVEKLQETIETGLKARQYAEKLKEDLAELEKTEGKIPQEIKDGLILNWNETGVLPSKIYREKIKPLLKTGKETADALERVTSETTKPGEKVTTEPGGSKSGGEKEPETVEEVEKKIKDLLHKHNIPNLE